MINLNPEVMIVGMGSPLQENYLIKLKVAGWSEEILAVAFCTNRFKTQIIIQTGLIS